MSYFTRRDFLRASLTSAAALQGGLGTSLFAQEPVELPRQSFNRPKFQDGAPDTLFLTWQRDPTTTMTVSWVGDELPADTTQIQCSVLGQDQWQPTPTEQRPYPADGVYVYRCELTGLAPDTQYEFRIGTSQPRHRFQTMPAHATDTFQFVSGGDSGANRHAVANNILAATQNPKFALVGGDLAYEDGLRIAQHLQYLRHYTQHMRDSDGRLIPLVPAIGNHEIADGPGPPQAPLFLALFDGLFADRTYNTLDFGDYLSLVLLDTDHKYPIAGEQTDWLDRALAQRTDRPHLIVAQHVPSYPSHRSFATTGEGSRQHWVPLFERHNVDVVLEHHDHTFKRTHPLKDGLANKNGLVFLGDGSWGALRPVTEPENRPYLATASSNYHITLHRLEGEQRFHMALTDGGRVADVCLTQKRPRHPQGRGAT